MPSAWHNKVVLVTGASSGLGRAIAEAFALQGAKVVLCARRLAPLSAAAEEIKLRGGDVLPLEADVTRQEQVEALFQQAIDRFGRLDVLVNNAGRSMRGAAMDTTVEDFQQMLDLNLLAVVRCTRAAMPHLLPSRGHLVNIGSLGGKSAGRYLGAYNASKFALSAYSQQLRLELGPQGLHVLLVCPGPLARDEVRTYGAEELNLPESARKPGGGVKTKRIEPAWLANQIVRACQRRQLELIVPSRARLLFALLQLSPRLGDYLVKKLS